MFRRGKCSIIWTQILKWTGKAFSHKLTWWRCINDGNTRSWSQPWPSSPGYSTVWRWIANKERSIGAVGINSKKEVTEGAFADPTRTQYHNPWLRKIVYCVVAAVNDTWTKCLLDLNIEIFPGLENFQNWNATGIFPPQYLPPDESGHSSVWQSLDSDLLPGQL